MVFNSYTFIIFFMVVLALHYTPFSWRVRKFNLLWASYLFYAAWNPPFVGLLLLSTVADWYLAKAIFTATSRHLRRLFLVVSLGVNLGLLGFFKYGGFLVENFVTLMAGLNVHYAPALPDIILPAGISFYTFQTLSYTIDIYRRKAVPWHSFLDYALYVTFFPQLVAGPIVRSCEFLYQLKEPLRANINQLGWGLSLMVVGLFNKVVLADGVFAPFVETVYAPSAVPGSLAAWSGSLAFAGQIFCDFAGYSTCAIGAAMCLGFKLPDNFRFPYAAMGFSDFWQRWHMTLSRWLRDYLYIPLGGNRHGLVQTARNLIITMFLGGLWHGASWTFVAWGLLHGFYLVAERLLQRFFGGLRIWQTLFGRVSVILATFICVTVAWVFFRAQSFAQAADILKSMFLMADKKPTLSFDLDECFIPVAAAMTLVFFHMIMRNTTLEQATAKVPWWLRACGLAVLSVAIIMMPGEDRAFIYFQF